MKTAMKKSKKKSTAQPIQLHGYEMAAVAALARQWSSTTPDERAEAIRLTRLYIVEHGFVPDHHGDYHSTIEGIAKVIDGPKRRSARAERDLDRIDKELKKARGKDVGPWAYETAYERWSPAINAALFFGLTLGLALANNGEGGAR